MEQLQTKLLPKNYINCERDDLVVLISRMLNSIIDLNDRQGGKELGNDNLTRFHSRTPPGISVYSYLMRLSRYSSLENAVLLATVYYIDSISQAYTNFSLNSLTVHRYLLTATTVGSKGLCDSFCTNSHYARVGGINATELEILEKEFLKRMKYLILPKNVMAADENTNYSDIDTDERDSGARRSGSITNIPNSAGVDQFDGFAVLDIYYRRMIDYVGTNLSIDSPDSPGPVKYILDPKERAQRFTHTNTLPDTMSDLAFVKYIKNLRLMLGNINLGQIASQKAEAGSQAQNGLTIVEDQQPGTFSNPTDGRQAQDAESSSSEEINDIPVINSIVSQPVAVQYPHIINIINGTNNNANKSSLKRSIEDDLRATTNFNSKNGDCEKKIRISNGNFNDLNTSFNVKKEENGEEGEDDEEDEEEEEDYDDNDDDEEDNEDIEKEDGY